MNITQYATGVQKLKTLESDGIFVTNEYGHACTLERVVRAPTPHHVHGLGIFCEITHRIDRGSVTIGSGACFITTNCNPADKPFTTNKGVQWNYWAAGIFPVTDDDAQLMMVSYSDLLVQLRAIFPAIEVVDDRLASWQEETRRQRELTATTYSELRFS